MGLVFSPQTTASLPLLSRPVILAVYERISITPSVSLLLSPPHIQHSTAWNLLLSLFWHQLGLFVYFWTVLSFCCSSQPAITSKNWNDLLLWVTGIMVCCNYSHAKSKMERKFKQIFNIYDYLCSIYCWEACLPQRKWGKDQHQHQSVSWGKVIQSGLKMWLFHEILFYMKNRALSALTIMLMVLSHTRKNSCCQPSCHCPVSSSSLVWTGRAESSGCGGQLDVVWVFRAGF